MLTNQCGHNIRAIGDTKLRRSNPRARAFRIATRKKIAPRQPSVAAVSEICHVLHRVYEDPRHGNPRKPLDDLIYIVLSTRTRDASFTKTFRILKENFPSWNKLLPKDRRKLERILVPGGLGRLKARQITNIITQLRNHFGLATLSPLAKMTDRDAERFLTALPGVGPKIAKCVLMYTLNRRVLPVDVHVHRLATRLGFWTKKRPDTSQELIENAIAPKLRYSFHVNAVAHGRAVCFGQRPLCGKCQLSKWCQYYRLHRGLKK
ncbi:MAG: endonuclease III domain-containing protein [Candidatus Acidiferrales bacterium]